MSSKLEDHVGAVRALIGYIGFRGGRSDLQRDVWELRVGRIPRLLKIWNLGHPPPTLTTVDRLYIMSPPPSSGKYKESGTARVLGSGTAGVAELLVFHPVDTIAKRLMSNKNKVIENYRTENAITFLMFCMLLLCGC